MKQQIENTIEYLALKGEINRDLLYYPEDVEKIIRMLDGSVLSLKDGGNGV